jgi:hypothetical protein
MTFAAAIVLLLTGGIGHCAAQTMDARRGLETVMPETGALREGDKDVLLGLFEAQTTTFPIGSAAGGFTWSFDSALGLPTRRSRSFGPMFSERPLTTGRRRLNVSMGFQRTEWRAMAGQNLQDGLYFAFVDEDGWFEYLSQFSLTTEQTVVTATYGLFDRVDIGVRVPYVRQHVSGAKLYTCAFCDGWTSTPVTGHSAGLGDITIRGKVLVPAPVVDLAAGIDLRLATGDQEKLLGAGNTQLTAILIGGGQTGPIAPHFNVGYTFAGPGLEYEDRYEQGEFRPSSEFKYAMGVEFVAAAPVTISADITGRALFKAATPYMYSSPGRAQGLSMHRRTVNLLLGAVSAKFLVSGMWLITTAVAFPLNDSGIQPGITPVFGFERAF